MKANIIHCNYYQDRLVRLIDELDNNGIKDFELWDGIVDPKSNQKGINQSHKQIVEYAKLADWDEVLIMEDDIRFCGEGSFKYFLDNKPQDFDIYLSGIYMGEISEDKTVKAFSGFHCYIVNSRFYDTFLSVPDDLHIDRALANLGTYKVCYPFAAIQYNGFSTNTKREENYDSLLDERELYGNYSL